MSEEEKTFVVKDRRRFSSESQQAHENKDLGEEDKKKAETERQETSAEKAAKEAYEKQESQKKPGQQQTYLPKINFQTFILSLNSSALVQLGFIEDPVGGGKEKNLPLAKQTIDILGMLEEKTKGNLDNDEEMMLKSILYELRMMYVREIR